MGLISLDTPYLIAADAVIALGHQASAAKLAAHNVSDPLAIASLAAIANALHESEGHLTARLRAIAQIQVERDEGE